MSTGRSIAKLYSITQMAATCCLLLGCIGDNLPEPEADEQPLISIQLPDDTRFTAAVTSGTNFRAGSDFDRDLPYLQAEPDSNRLALAGNPVYGDLSYAMFSFPQADPGWEPQVELDWYALDPANEHMIVSRDEARPFLYLGISDYSRGAWKWFPLSQDSIGLPELDRYISESGNLYLVLVSMAPNPLRLEWLRVGDSQWMVEYLEITDIFSDRITAAMDSNDQPRFCNGNRYVWRDNSGWHIETIDADIVLVYKLLLDDEDKPHICGIIPGDWGLSMYGYATRPSITWSQQWTTQIMTTPMGQPPYDGPWASIDMALDSHGVPHFAYFSEMERDLYYSAPMPGGGWTKEIVDAEGETGEKCAIVLDPDDNPYIAYHANNHTQGRLAAWDGSQWQIDTLLSGGSNGVAAAVLSGSDLVVAFAGESLQLYQQAAGWLPQEVGECAGGGCLMQLQADGTPVIQYHRFSSFATALSAWKAGQWQHRWVDLPETHDLVIYPDNDGLMIDSSGNPHLVYIIGFGIYKAICYAHLE